MLSKTITVTCLLLSVFWVNTTYAGEEYLTRENVIDMTVEEYLSILESGDSTLLFKATVSGWPSGGDIEYLLNKLGDMSPSRSVALHTSSYLDGGRSTIGIESYFLLLGIMHGEYPPALNSTRHQLESIEEVRLWAEERIKEQKEKGPHRGAEQTL